MIMLKPPWSSIFLTNISERDLLNATQDNSRSLPQNSAVSASSAGSLTESALPNNHSLWDQKDRDADAPEGDAGDEDAADVYEIDGETAFDDVTDVYEDSESAATESDPKDAEDGEVEAKVNGDGQYEKPKRRRRRFERKH